MDYIYSQVKKKLWWSNILSAGYFTSTVGENGNENQIKNHMRNKKIHQIYRDNWGPLIRAY